MKEESARTLLNKIMGWTRPQDASDEHPALQALSAYGYDDYQQFTPSMRFIESLAIWLNRFPQNNRKAAYQFIKDRLLFITRPQTEHIVSIAYRDYIIPILLRVTSKISKNQEWEISKISKSIEFQILRDQCLFLGLSDGSHIDSFRRSSVDINHEQVFRTHEINGTRVSKMLDDLKTRLSGYDKTPPSNFFRMVFLLDDFSASGISYLKEDLSAPNGVKGKIANFLDSINDKGDPISKLVNTKDLQVYVILYTATESAISYIRKIGKKAFGTILFEVIGINQLPDSIKFDPATEKEFFELVKQKQYGWEDLDDPHYQQGNSDKLYLGFNDGALPLILYHNTPNNSLPILHRNDSKTSFKGLFPRISRHH